MYISKNILRPDSLFTTVLTYTQILLAHHHQLELDLPRLGIALQLLLPEDVLQHLHNLHLLHCYAVGRVQEEGQVNEVVRCRGGVVPTALRRNGEAWGT